jgi:hypothetical protein
MAKTQTRKPAKGTDKVNIAEADKLARKRSAATARAQTAGRFSPGGGADRYRCWHSGNAFGTRCREQRSVFHQQ